MALESNFTLETNVLGREVQSNSLQSSGQTSKGIQQTDHLRHSGHSNTVGHHLGNEKGCSCKWTYTTDQKTNHKNNRRKVPHMSSGHAFRPNRLNSRNTRTNVLHQATGNHTDDSKPKSQIFSKQSTSYQLWRFPAGSGPEWRR